MHHATVIRHVDALEQRLGVKLFQRHARGYTATEAGQELLLVAQATEDQFSQLANRIRGRGRSVSGELVVTSIPGLARVISPSLSRFQLDHPEVVVRYLTGERLFRLEYGEAHVAIRSGSAPEQPDNVVQPFLRQQFGLYASEGYEKRHGVPASLQDFASHRFVGTDDAQTRAPFGRWLRAHVGEAQITYRYTDLWAGVEAIRAGAGIGFVAVRDALTMDDLVEVMAPRPEWEVPLWLVTHVDLHRTNKVQALLNHLKADSRNWQGF